MNPLAAFLLRVLALAAGLVFAASLAVVTAVLLGFWLLRSAWARLAGRPAAPFIVRTGPRHGFSQAMRRPPGRRPGDVTDVEPK